MSIAYAAGPPGYVVHKTGARFDREACEAIQRYLVREIASPAWGPELTEGRKRDLADLEAAMAASFTDFLPATSGLMTTMNAEGC
jgi:hypothetical protein